MEIKLVEIVQALLYAALNHSEQEMAYNLKNSTDNSSYFKETPCSSLLTGKDEEYFLVTRICLYIDIGLVAFGVVGNCVNFIVVFKNTKRQSSNLYIIFLAISDSAVLLMLFLGNVLKTLKCLRSLNMDIDLINHNNILCKVYYYMLNLFMDYSSLLILLFTTERFIAVFKPMKVHQLCSFKRTIITCSLLFIFLAILVCPLYVLSVGVEENFHLCSAQPFHDQVVFLFVAEIVIFRIVPTFPIIVFNARILYKLLRPDPLLTTHVQKRQKNHSRQVTIILILTSTSYVIFYLPFLIHYFLFYAPNVNVLMLEILSQITSRLYITGFAINCYLYVIGSTLSRDQLKSMLYHCSPKGPITHL